MTADDWIDAMLPGAKMEVLVGERVWVELPGCPGCCGSGSNGDEAFENLFRAMERFFQMETGAGRTLPVLSDLPRLKSHWTARTADFEKSHAKEKVA